MFALFLRSLYCRPERQAPHLFVNNTVLFSQADCNLQSKASRTFAEQKGVWQFILTRNGKYLTSCSGYHRLLATVFRDREEAGYSL